MIRVVAVGRLKAPYYRQAMEDYRRRISHFARLEITEVIGRGPLPEGRLLLDAAAGEPVIACDPQGEAFDSRHLSALLGRHGSPCFLLGGPEGLSSAVLEQSGRILSLSPLTFPHELARVILLEQIYRGLSLLRGHPYHR